MKKMGIIILVLLFCSTIKAQNFVFGAFNLTGATNTMSSSELERPFERYYLALTGDLEFSGYITEILAIRSRSSLSYCMSNNLEYIQATWNCGIGITVGDIRRFYGFAEIRPRFRTGGTTLSYSKPTSAFFTTALIGLGYNHPITEQAWFIWELGFSQNFTIITRNGGKIRDESGGFLTIGIRYLINDGQ